MTKLTKPELIERIAETGGFTKKDAADFLDALNDVVTEILTEGNEVSIFGGKLYPKHLSERQGVRPGTTERISIPASVTVGFKAGVALKELLNPQI